MMFRCSRRLWTPGNGIFVLMLLLSLGVISALTRPAWYFAKVGALSPRDDHTESEKESTLAAKVWLKRAIQSSNEIGPEAEADHAPLDDSMQEAYEAWCPLDEARRMARDLLSIEEQPLEHMTVSERISRVQEWKKRLEEVEAGEHVTSWKALINESLKRWTEARNSNEIVARAKNALKDGDYQQCVKECLSLTEPAEKFVSLFDPDVPPSLAEKLIQANYERLQKLHDAGRLMLQAKSDFEAISPDPAPGVRVGDYEAWLLKWEAEEFDGGEKPFHNIIEEPAIQLIAKVKAACDAARIEVINAILDDSQRNDLARLDKAFAAYSRLHQPLAQSRAREIIGKSLQNYVPLRVRPANVSDDLREAVGTNDKIGLGLFSADPKEKNTWSYTSATGDMHCRVTTSTIKREGVRYILRPPCIPFVVQSVVDYNEQLAEIIAGDDLFSVGAWRKLATLCRTLETSARQYREIAEKGVVPDEYQQHYETISFKHEAQVTQHIVDRLLLYASPPAKSEDK